LPILRKAGDLRPRPAEVEGWQGRWENVVLAYKACNGKKADRMLSELGWKLNGKPKAPTGAGWIVIGLAKTEPAWEAYLGMAA
jgi:hypothetical protein